VMGGLIVAPRSIHANRHRYEWDVAAHPTEVEIADAPEWFLQFLPEKGIWNPNPPDTETQIAESLRLCVSVSEAIERSMPVAEGQRNRNVFNFARALKSVPGMEDASEAVRVDALKRWHAAALPIIKTKDFSVTLAEFTYAWDRIKAPLGSGLPDQLMAKANAADAPAVASEYEELPILKKLVCLTYQMQLHHGKKPFFLSCRDAGALIGVHFETASKLLGHLVRDGVLELVERGVRPKASSYRFIGAKR
jgi:hypothetical protein